MVFGQITIERAAGANYEDGSSNSSNSGGTTTPGTNPRNFSTLRPHSPAAPPTIPTRKVTSTRSGSTSSSTSTGSTTTLRPAAHQGFVSSRRKKTTASHNLPHHTFSIHQRELNNIHRRHLCQTTTATRNNNPDAVSSMQRTPTRPTTSNATNQRPAHADDDAYLSSPGGRDSHDLTFTSNNPIARESLVENMLLSLDRLGTSDFGFSLDTSFNQFFPTNEIADIDYVDEDEYYEDAEGLPGPYHNPPLTPDNRSHPSNLVNTPYQHNQQASRPNYLASASQRGFPNRDKSLPSTPSQQSFSDGYARDGHPVPSRPETSNQGRPFPGGAYSVEIYSDAAPTPTIPNRSRDRGPPSRNQSSYPLSPATVTFSPAGATPLPPPPPPPPPPLPRLERKRSNTTRSYKREKFLPNPIMDDTAPVSQTLDSSPAAPAPSVPQTASKASGTQRAGFFRRVFGGSNKTPTTQNVAGSSENPTTIPPPPPPQQPAASTATTAATVSQEPAPGPIPIAADAPSVPSSRPQTVTKKASGFFRRRKRSVTDFEANQMPRTPFHQLPSQQFDLVENPLPSPPPPHMPQGSFAVMSAPAPMRPVETFAEPIRRAETPSKQVQDGFVPNKVTTSPSNKNNDDADRKPTIRTVTSQNILPASSLAAFDNIGKDEDPATMPSVSADTEKPPPTLKETDIGLDGVKSAENATPKKDAEGFSTSLRRSYTPKRTLTQDSNSTNDDADVPDEVNGTRGLRVMDEDDLSQRTPTRNSSTPVVVLNDSGDAANGEVDPDATPQPKRKKDNEVDVGEPSEEEKEKAKKIFEGDEEFMSKARAAAWLGETGDPSTRIRQAYMAMFDFSNVNFLAAMRMLCEKLVLKGETQQVERILDAMANRWLDCNPSHGFKCIDVVRTIMYSLLLLNTDLHVADIPHSQKMTRSQFIRNTMTAVRKSMADADLTTSAFPAQNTLPARSQTPQLLSDERDDTQLSPSKAKLSEGRSSLDQPRSNRLSFIRGAAGIAPRFFDDLSMDLGFVQGLDGSNGENGGPFVNTPFNGSSKQWEMVLEAILKDFYASVRLSALPLHGMSSDRNIDSGSNSSSLMVSCSLRRTPSTVSKAPSEMSLRTPGDRYGNVVNSARSDTAPKFGSSKWGLKNRSRPRLYPSSFAGSSRTSFEDRMWSPSASSTWSKYSLDKTTPSMMSVDSLGAGFGHKDYQQSIGFANALSHAIIREEAASGSAVSLDGTESMQNVLVDEDLEDLALHGAPWAKEGLVKHKHHLEAVGKKAKNRGWTECFAVVSKGCMRLFLFPSSDKKKGQQQQKGGLVGGGNWLENAESIGSFMLRQSIASALPPPGYSKSRPHVLALSLPTGAVHLFQVGTADIVKEWVTTANYWSARLSKEPLIGAVSNIEYGWGNCLDPALIHPGTSSSSRPATSMSSRPSFQESIRSSMDHGMGARARLPGDKAVIGEWQPPSQSMVASNLGEKDQLKALEAYVKNVEDELQKHNELRSAMVLAFTPRHINYSKAMNNWERKSSYLLREIVKFQTYIDALTTAIEMREKILSEREAEDDDRSQLECPDVPKPESNDIEIAA